ncbi:MAG TPA: T9SS type A sorting domain-containing protein, partial [Chitinophagales bacterium]|nr:T9SS type A sorting domain-containing protein [Chitinophagales bacterium]
IVTHLIIDSLDTSVTQADNILTANFPSANYQWVDCNNGWQAISGATDQVFTVTINGNYAVIISDSSGCSDTSACYLVIGLQTATVNSVYEVKLFPTPADQTLQIECKNFGDDILISLYTVDGKMVKEIASTNSSIGLSTADLPAGFYILRCENLHSGKPQNMKFAVIHND